MEAIRIVPGVGRGPALLTLAGGLVPSGHLGPRFCSTSRGALLGWPVKVAAWQRGRDVLIKEL